MTKRQKKSLVRCIAAGAVLVAVYLIAHFIDLPWWAELLLFLVPYAIAGYDVVVTAVKNIFHGQVFDEKFLMTIASLGAFAVGENADRWEDAFLSCIR